ncbi:MAG: energy-coupling factor ABC transporter ATP-binding protein [Desulfovibrio sp.]|jgi:cobalt/nickel transport system ATP-binding protein|nr:energy-coupling factor ABC transporter ATP-binding protein [Desulfovibrio sp.]
MAETSLQEVIFSLEHVHFSYIQGDSRREVLRDVNFALSPARRFGLFGPNGSGKTTFFRCITGLVRPQRGVRRFHGIVLNSEKDFHALRCKVGFVLQHAEDQLFFPTVLEDVAFGPLNLGMTPEAARDRALETLKSLRLDGFENRLTHRLSGGEKKLISLATVLAMRPEALLLDEPTSGLDNEARERLIDILRGLSTASIVISHDWDFLSQVSTDCLTIHDGRLSACSHFFAHTHMHPLGNEPHGNL